jgi:superfamily II DNA or RNA helicase
MVLFDECHHASAPTAQKILTSCPAFFRWGASDSIHKDDPSARTAMIGVLGPILTSLAAKPHLDTGRLAQPTIYIVDVDTWHNRFIRVPHRPVANSPAWVYQDEDWKKGLWLGPVYERDAKGQVLMARRKIFENGKAVWEKQPVIEPGWQTVQIDGQAEPLEVESTFCLMERAYDRAIVRFRERNDLIVAWAKYYALQKNWPTLIVCTRTLHNLVLENALLKSKVPSSRVRVLLGLHDSRERDDAFAWLVKPGVKARILISPLVKEGVNLPELTSGVIADYVADVEVANQILGRFMRRKTGLNQAHVTWFLDRQVPSFRQGCQRVFHGLRQLEGYQFVHPVQGPPPPNKNYD